jgi:hypothetical protein
VQGPSRPAPDARPPPGRAATQALTEPEFEGKLAVILAGYEEDIDGLLAVNAGMARRFPTKFVFPDLSTEAMAQLLAGFLARVYNGLQLAPEALAALPALLAGLRVMPKFSNGGTAETLAQLAYRKRALRLQEQPAAGVADSAVSAQDLKAAAAEATAALADVAPAGTVAPPPIDFEAITSIEDVFRSQGLLGLDGIKQQLREMEASIRAAVADKKPCPVELCFLFVGPPGTGRAARLQLAWLRPNGTAYSAALRAQQMRAWVCGCPTHGT